MIRLIEFFGHLVITRVEEVGRMFLFFIETMKGWRPGSLNWKRIITQMEFIGVKSLSVVILTGTFTGMVLALQSFQGFRRFGAESLVGTTVALSMTRELGPVLTSLMVTARAGSAMAAELGTMRVTEQIDALTVMAVEPLKYLVVPRIIAAAVMVPILTIISNFVGIAGGYFVGVRLLGINSGTYIDNTVELVTTDDVYNGLVKAFVFGLILSFVGCYKGFNTTGGAQGVGRATTEAVVLSSVLILVSDYFLTAIMFAG